MAFISGYIVTAQQKVNNGQHSHGHIVIVIAGTCCVSFENQQYNLTSRQICFIPPNTVHTMESTGNVLVLDVPEEMIKSIDLVFLTENSILEINENLAPLITLIRYEVENRNFTNNESLRYLYYYLYDKFVEQYRLPSLQYIHENYADEISITKLAAIENYNVSYFTSWFKKKTGCVPSDYLKIVRIEKAKEILTTTRYRVIDVALQVGYKDSSAFIRAFSGLVGMTPNQYRRMALENKNRANKSLTRKEGEV
ncbi:MAG: helix-turn-helix transcriptional regulator [Oscillospiraceae bacterium]|nr:helix-turn-helix transcriptional regulator [Oscillospiraceae bacterium]MBP1570671.1 helix-turn-helix transcriptional regulator [Oscillospiraceae bacterium]